MLTADRLREVLDYNPETGEFRWRVTNSTKVPAGTRAGYRSARDGYWRVQVDNRMFLSHRLAWLYVYGRWPEAEIDHINLIRDDNRLANLREASRAQNSRNLRAHRDNRAGLKGVSRDLRSGRYEAAIMAEGERRRLGWFATAEEAHQTYCKAVEELHGKFARTA